MFCKRIFQKHDYVLLIDKIIPMIFYDGYGDAWNGQNSRAVVHWCRSCDKTIGKLYYPTGLYAGRLTQKEIKFLTNEQRTSIS